MLEPRSRRNEDRLTDRDGGHSGDFPARVLARNSDFWFRISVFARITAMPIDDILMEAEIHMEKAVEHLQHELRGIRTGRATPALVEHLKVEYYGSMTDLRSIASISVPEATQLLIKPFSPSDMHAIEKAINDSKI